MPYPGDIEVCVLMAALLCSIVASDHLNKCCIFCICRFFHFISRELMWHDVVFFYMFLAAKGAALDSTKSVSLFVKYACIAIEQ